jgi:hypothetical protein
MIHECLQRSVVNTKRQRGNARRLATSLVCGVGRRCALHSQVLSHGSRHFPAHPSAHDQSSADRADVGRSGRSLGRLGRTAEDAEYPTAEVRPGWTGDPCGPSGSNSRRPRPPTRMEGRNAEPGSSLSLSGSRSLVSAGQRLRDPPARRLRLLPGTVVDRKHHRGDLCSCHRQLRVPSKRKPDCDLRMGPRADQGSKTPSLAHLSVGAPVVSSCIALMLGLGVSGLALSWLVTTAFTISTNWIAAN